MGCLMGVWRCRHWGGWIRLAVGTASEGSSLLPEDENTHTLESIMKGFKMRQKLNKDLQWFIYFHLSCICLLGWWRWTIRILIRITIWWKCILGNQHWTCILHNCSSSCSISCLPVNLINQIWNWKLRCISLITTFIILVLRHHFSQMNCSLTWSWNSSCHSINKKWNFFHLINWRFCLFPVWIHSTWHHWNNIFLTVYLDENSINASMLQ